jgi:hypothetical protein
MAIYVYDKVQKKTVLKGTTVADQEERAAAAFNILPTHDRRFTSHSLPKNWKYAPHHDAQGRCQFHNASEVRECVARSQDDPDIRERVQYDD